MPVAETKTQRRVRLFTYVVLALGLLLFLLVGISLFKVAVRAALPAPLAIQQLQIQVANLNDESANYAARIEELEKVVVDLEQRIIKLNECYTEVLNRHELADVQLIEDLDILRGQLLALREQLETHTHDEHSIVSPGGVDVGEGPRDGCR